ncbi:hypothetical protein [Psychroserpens mesophilus]|uniref:hypothetical protein n=1 Tax=Psychroserpens mesophilus TaxID=325473 RepID=UPI00058EA249|nr:hypothetical protein [Psychroserpens mesophilus]
MKKSKLEHIKTSGFTTPKDYFSTVEEQILNETSLKNKVDKAGFVVPDKYFDTVDQDILNRLENDTPVINLRSRRTFYYVAGIAASLVLMLNVFYTSETITINDVETASIENYLEDSDYTSYELAALLTEDELNSFNLINTEISEASIEDYLLNHVTIEDLIIE